MMTTVLLAAGTAVLLLATTGAAAAGRLPPNGLVGLRTPALLRSDEGWRAGHRAAFAVLGPACAAVLVACGVLTLGHPVGARATELVGGVLLVGLLGVAIGATVLAHRRARDAAAEEERRG